MRRAAEFVEKSRRRDDLNFSYYAEVSPLPQNYRKSFCKRQKMKSWVC